MWFKKFLIFIIVIAFLLTGCASKKGSMKGTKEIIVIPKSNINKGLSLKILIVQVYSEEALNEISAIEAEQFFDKAKNITLSFPGEVKIWEFDLIENSQSICFVLPSRKKYWGAFVFFKFTENVENKFLYPNDLKAVELTIEDSKFEITNVDHKNKYTKDKVKKPLCLYLAHDDCLYQPSNQNLKKKRFG